MNTFEKIKKILEYGSGKAIVLDHEATPAFIVMNWKEYEKILHTIDVLRGLQEQPIHHVPRPSHDQLTLNDLPL
ncbi:MAG: hypothetical protein HZA35_02365 [Parcubacteria group bacterium]|nr:hypothetical protein [Parcubacteria group bacterium]